MCLKRVFPASASGSYFGGHGKKKNPQRRNKINSSFQRGFKKIFPALVCVNTNRKQVKLCGEAAVWLCLLNCFSHHPNTASPSPLPYRAVTLGCWRRALWFVREESMKEVASNFPLERSDALWDSVKTNVLITYSSTYSSSFKASEMMALSKGSSTIVRAFWSLQKIVPRRPSWFLPTPVSTFKLLL